MSVASSMFSQTTWFIPLLGSLLINTLLRLSVLQWDAGIDFKRENHANSWARNSLGHHFIKAIGKFFRTENDRDRSELQTDWHCPLLII